MLEVQPGADTGTYVLTDPDHPEAPAITISEAELHAEFQPMPEIPTPTTDRHVIARRIHDGIQGVILQSGAVRDQHVDVTLIVEQLVLLGASYAHLRPDDTEDDYVDFARTCYQHAHERLRAVVQGQGGPSIVVPPTGR